MSVTAAASHRAGGSWGKYLANTSIAGIGERVEGFELGGGNPGVFVQFGVRAGDPHELVFVEDLAFHRERDPEALAKISDHAGYLTPSAAARAARHVGEVLAERQGLTRPQVRADSARLWLMPCWTVTWTVEPTAAVGMLLQGFCADYFNPFEDAVTGAADPSSGHPYLFDHI